jgi:hypothetical protein
MRTALLLFVLLSLGCGDKLRSWQAPNTQPPLPFQPKEKLFLIPVSITIKGEQAVASQRFTEAFLAEFLPEAYPSSPELDKSLEESGVTGLSKALAEAMVSGALNHNNGNYFQVENAYLNEQLGALFSLLVTKEIKARYIAAAHITARPKTKDQERFEVMGGIYDVEKGTTVVVVDFFVEASSAALSSQLPALGKRLANQLKCPSDQKTCR